jgi:predicted nucleotide-binding protein (sugar kinase/HSP70/actin superfamily)
MIKTMRKHGFYSLDVFSDFKKEVSRYVNQGYIIADGWLIGGEITAHILHDCKKVLAMQPFGCMPNHTCGRGMYPHLSRLFPEGRIVSVDFDSSSSEVTIFNRVKMLLDFNV